MKDPRWDRPVPNPVDLIKALAGLRRSVALYPSGHAIIRKVVEDLAAHLADVFRDREDLRIQLVDGVAHADGYPFRVESLAHRRELEGLEQVGVRCLELERGVSREELVAMAELLHELRDEPRERPLAELLAERGVERIRLTKLVRVASRRSALEWPDEPPAVIGRAYESALDAARAAITPVFEGAPVQASSIDALLDQIGALVEDSTALGQILGVKRYDNHTFVHSINVAALALLLGRRLELDERRISWLVEGALLHDVGKRRVPKQILCKAGSLNRREWRVMQRHPVAGAEILVNVPGLGPLTPTIALEHHCHYDGGGYPALEDQVPHALSRVVAVADTYEALTGARPYREPLIPEEACLVLARLAGEKLDPALVRAFVGLITFFPLGTVVRTDREETGVVVRTSEREPLHPVIELLEPTAGIRVDTAERGPDGAYLRHVVETLPTPVAEARPEPPRPERGAATRAAAGGPAAHHLAPPGPPG